ncbi:MAG: proprotein convertase P-domain-containing protein [Elainellaceae cyanobacterium]
MRNEFVNEVPIVIPAGPANITESIIEVPDLNDATLTNIEVLVDISHTWVGDLVISLRSPKGTEVTLAARRGGASDNFRNTIFRASAQTPIQSGNAPFRGTFRPEGDLTRLNGEPVGGMWTLVVDDQAAQDGGAINRWAIGLETDVVQPSAFRIDVRFLGGLSPRQQIAFASAAQRWSEIITGDLTPAMLDGEQIDDVLIEAQGINIDGPDRILGQAGPTFLRPVSNLPIKGIMSFDSADLDRLEADDSLEDVILHEMAHVLGFGTLWSRMNLIVGAGTVNPTFVGNNAMREYAALTDRTVPTPVPVANTGGPGTRDGHWREVVFGNELLTGFISGFFRPISRTSVAAFEDMGYEVNYAAANQYSLPSMLRIAELGLLLGERRALDTCVILVPEPVVVPPGVLINTET